MPHARAHCVNRLEVDFEDENNADDSASCKQEHLRFSFLSDPELKLAGFNF